MRTKGIKKSPQVIYRGSKPVSVIIDIKQYKEMVERLEDIEDMKALNKIMKRPQSFVKLDDFLQNS